MPVHLWAGNDLSVADAEAYADGQRPVWREIFDVFGVDAQLAEAVIFPELVRYNALQDVIEAAAASSSYVMLGQKGADYSVGPFQMKISFAEALERRWMQSPTLPRQYDAWFDLQDTHNARSVRASRVSDPLWQCVYLAMFIRLLELDYPDLAEMSPEHRVRWVATAYNRGVPLPGKGKGDTSAIESHLYDLTFHTAFIPMPTTTRYCYSTIALEHYNRH